MRALRHRALTLAVLATPLIAAACGGGSLSPGDAQEAIAGLRRFRAPQMQAVRSRYCSAPVPVAGAAGSTPGTAADDPANAGATPAGDVNRLRALQDAGAIRVERHAATASECVGVARPIDAVVVIVTDTGNSFHPRPLDGAPGWEFPLGERKLLSVGEITYNQEDPPTLAHIQYQWAWQPTLLGQLLQVTNTPQTASAAFRRTEGEWQLADIGF